MIANEKGLSIGPKEFQEPGFWEAYFNGDNEARKTLAEVWERLGGSADVIRQRRTSLIVECERLIDRLTGLPEERSPLITVGKKYVVLEILGGSSEKPMLLRVMPDCGQTPVLVDGLQFEISPVVPEGWVAVQKDGGLNIGPNEEFVQPEFREAFSKGDQNVPKKFFEIWNEMNRSSDITTDSKTRVSGSR